MAKAVLSRFQLVVEGHPLIENEAFPPPAAVLLRNLLEVLENAASQVMHFTKPLLLQVAAGFLAADTAGAEHGDPLRGGAVHQGAKLAFGPLRKVPEAVGAGVDGTGKAADGGFVVVARVDHQRVGVIHQGVPVLRIHIGADVGAGIHSANPHGHDLFLAPGLETAEHRPLRPAALHFQPCAVVVAELQRGSQVAQQAIDSRLGTTDRAVHTFTGHQHRAEHMAFARKRR